MMYRFLIFSTFCLGIISINSLQAQDTCKCDYIASGYYQLVYEAEIARLEGNDRLAYEKLQQAEKTCTLLNQPLYHEMELYSRLLLKNEDFDKSIHYMEKLATEYGKMPDNILFILDEDSVLKNDLLLKYPAFDDSILPAIMQKCNDFYTPERKQLIAELTEMTKIDQEVRGKRNMKINPEDDPAYIILKQTDSINAKHFFEIVKKYGYPNMKRFGDNFQNMRLLAGIQVMIVHISCSFNIEEMILQYVRDGECEPNLYGFIIDKGILEGKWKKNSLYGIWENVRDDKIIDVLHLDERRIAVGMPTREMENKRNELIDKR
jgi:hypothetical protein